MPPRLLRRADGPQREHAERGRLWIAAADLVEAGVPEALAGRLAHLGGYLLELGRLAEAAGALAAHLSDSLAVSYLSDDFAEAQQACEALTAVGALCATVRRTAADAQEWAAGIDGELSGLVSTDDF